MFLKIIHKSIQKKLVINPSLKNFKNLLNLIEIKLSIKKENILIYYFDLDQDQILLMNNKELLIFFEIENLLNNFFVLYVEKRDEIFDVKKMIFYNILSRLYMNDFIRKFEKVEIKNNFLFFQELNKLDKKLDLSKFKKKKLFRMILKEYEVNYLEKIKIDKKIFLLDFLEKKREIEILNFIVVKKCDDFLVKSEKKHFTSKLAQSLYLHNSKKIKKKDFPDYTQFHNYCISCQNFDFNMKKQFKVGFLCKQCQLENRRKAYFLKK